MNGESLLASQSLWAKVLDDKYNFGKKGNSLYGEPKLGLIYTGFK